MSNINEEVPKSIGWSCAVTEDLHLGQISSLLTLAQISSNSNTSLKILLDDSDYTLKPNRKLIDTNFINLTSKISNILQNLNIQNVSFHKSTDVRNNENFVNDFYKLISVTSEQDAFKCLDKHDDVKMGDLLVPVIKFLDFVHLDVDKVVYNNEKYIRLGEGNKDVLDLEKDIGFIFSGTIFDNKKNKMTFFDKMSAIWICESEKSISKKINKYFCEEGNVDCYVFEIYEHVIFKFYEMKKKILEIDRDGETLKIESIEELKDLFRNKKIHPSDLKNNCSRIITSIFAQFNIK
ncbi:cytoplasmic tyrosyl-tRNA synthetase (YARS) [Vairimorpha necatrix]|uniref:tyrosine--tRNA ligase n=1 Tax=Vairimorpha necatrix TaxID=6039 RepID=A0AAX4JC78_9MICR